MRSTQSGYIVNRYDTISQLLQALAEEPLFLKFGEAWVCVHPGLVREPAEYQALRQQVEANGLELLLTATASPDGVELRRYTT